MARLIGDLGNVGLDRGGNESLKHVALVLLLALLALAACAPPPVRLSNNFDPNEVQFIRTPGTAVITGQAFMRQRGGGVVTCAGSRALLIPVTRYSSERISIRFGNTNSGFISVNAPRNLEQAPAEYEASALKTTCDAQGNFRFEQVPAGDFFLMTSVQWEIPSGYATMAQGGALMQRVSVAPGQIQSVMLSK